MILKSFTKNFLLKEGKMILKIILVIKFLKIIQAISMYWKLSIIILIIDYLFNLLKNKVLHLFTNLDCGVRIVMVLKGFFEIGIITSFSRTESSWLESRRFNKIRRFMGLQSKVGINKFRKRRQTVFKEGRKVTPKDSK